VATWHRDFICSWPAAELLQDGRLSRAADVYSFAMIMWEMFACKRLYEGHIASQVWVSGPTLLAPQRKTSCLCASLTCSV
jgi:hypothetical protein